MKTELINCDRCKVSIPNGPPNSWFQNTTVAMWSMSTANFTNDLCVNCNTDYIAFLDNQVVNPR